MRGTILLLLFGSLAVSASISASVRSDTLVLA